jgi:hypothetical protein
MEQPASPSLRERLGWFLGRPRFRKSRAEAGQTYN